MKVAVSALLLFCLFCVGCASDSVTSTNGGLVVTELKGPGDFRYIHKGAEFHRFASNTAGKTYAELRTTIPVTDRYWLDISLQHEVDEAQHLPAIGITMRVYFRGDAAVGTYVLDSGTDISAFLMVDSNGFRGSPGGSIVITHYDPVSNLVSGSFEFTGSTWPIQSPFLYDTIEGAFQDVGILLNGNEHGKLTATLNDTASLTTDLEWQAFVAAWSDNSQNGYTIQAQFQDTSFKTYPMRIEIPSLSPGNYSFEWDDSVRAVWFNVGMAMKGAGTLQITRSDPTTRRFDASFDFRGLDRHSGDSVRIIGKIDNVQWFRL